MMGQGFNFKFDEMKDGSPSKNEAEKAVGNSYAEAGHVRNVCFVWPDGKMKFLNYAYLVSGEFSPTDGKITLFFTSETVVIKGTGLEALFEKIIDHYPKKILSENPRYKMIESFKDYFVEEILIEK